MSFDIWGDHLPVGHCEVHPGIAEEYPCSYCLAERQSQPLFPEPPLCDVCGVGEAVAAVAGKGVCSSECHEAAERGQEATS